MSDTPETDAFQQTEQCAYDSMWRGFARKLERERDDWKHRAESYETSYNELKERINLLKRMGILSSLN